MALHNTTLASVNADNLTVLVTARSTVSTCYIGFFVRRSLGVACTLSAFPVDNNNAAAIDKSYFGRYGHASQTVAVGDSDQEAADSIFAISKPSPIHRCHLVVAHVDEIGGEDVHLPSSRLIHTRPPRWPPLRCSRTYILSRTRPWNLKRRTRVKDAAR